MGLKLKTNLTVVIGTESSLFAAGISQMIKTHLIKTGIVRYDSRNFTLLKLNGARGNLASIGQQVFLNEIKRN